MRGIPRSPLVILVAHEHRRLAAAVALEHERPAARQQRPAAAQVALGEGLWRDDAQFDVGRGLQERRIRLRQDEFDDIGRHDFGAIEILQQRDCIGGVFRLLDEIVIRLHRRRVELLAVVEDDVLAQLVRIFLAVRRDRPLRGQPWREAAIGLLANQRVDIVARHEKCSLLRGAMRIEAARFGRNAPCDGAAGNRLAFLRLRKLSAQHDRRDDDRSAWRNTNLPHWGPSVGVFHYQPQQQRLAFSEVIDGMELPLHLSAATR
jgi:hypothetical protein